MKKSKMLIKFDPYGAINDKSWQSHFNCDPFILLQWTLIVHDTYGECCEPCSFWHVHILIHNVTQVFCVFNIYIILLDHYYYHNIVALPLWDTARWYMHNDHQCWTPLNQKLQLPYYTILLSNLPIMATSPQQPLWNFPKVAVVADSTKRFDYTKTYKEFFERLSATVYN